VYIIVLVSALRSHAVPSQNVEVEQALRYRLDGSSIVKCNGKATRGSSDLGRHSIKLYRDVEKPSRRSRAKEY
jgi:hypothetical protein